MLEATSIGSPLRSLIADSRGSIFSVHRKIINLDLFERLVTIADYKLGRGPFTINVKTPDDLSFNTLVTNNRTTVIFSSDFIKVGNSILIIGIKDANRYDATLQTESLDIKRFVKNLELFKHTILAEGSPEGVLGLLELHNNTIPRGVIRSAIASKTSSHMKTLFLGMKENDLLSVEYSLKQLIGLGIGTTPSCDDMLCGMMLIMRALAPHSDHLFNITESLCALARRVSIGRTNKISQEYLWYASKGLAAEVVKQVIESLVSSSPKAIYINSRKLLRIGESSGTDIAVGIALGGKFCINILNEC